MSQLPAVPAETLEHQLREARARYRELTHEQHRIQHIVRMVSHDLRSPMQDLELILSLVEDAPDHRVDERSLHVARHALSRMARLVDDLMCSSRSRVRHVPLDARPIDIAMPLLEAVEPLRDRALGAGLDLRVRVPAVTPPVRADADRVEQIVTNLVVNAIKYTRAPGWIAINATTCCDLISIRVVDSGPGMIPEDVAKAFEPFWQGSQRESGGVGLGLSISRNIVRAHGGRIWLDSDLGTGTSVTFTLPLAL